MEFIIIIRLFNQGQAASFGSRDRGQARLKGAAGKPGI
jgi:hypothetical protein